MQRLEGSQKTKDVRDTAFWLSRILLLSEREECDLLRNWPWYRLCHYCNLCLWWVLSQTPPPLVAVPLPLMPLLPLMGLVRLNRFFCMQGTSLIYVDRCTAQQAMMKPPSGLKKLQLGLELTQELDLLRDLLTPQHPDSLF